MNREEIFQLCKKAQNSAHGKILVGAVCSGVRFANGEIQTKYFSGSNLHISDSFADIHAEQLAVNLCLLERYYPNTIYVTSTSFEENVTMCGSCRHYISEININCQIVVFNPDGTEKTHISLSNVYPFSKNVEKKNKEFRELCNRGKV